jgi:hypothetical protein
MHDARRRRGLLRRNSFGNRQPFDVAIRRLPWRAADIRPDAEGQARFQSRRSATAATPAATSASGDADLLGWIRDRSDGDLSAAASSTSAATAARDEGRARLIAAFSSGWERPRFGGAFFVQAAFALTGSRPASSNAERNRSISSPESFFPSARVR